MKTMTLGQPGRLHIAALKSAKHLAHAQSGTHRLSMVDPWVLNFPITVRKPSACLRPDSPCAGDGRPPVAVPVGLARVGEPSGHLGSPRRSHHLKYSSDLGWDGYMELSLCCSSALSRVQDACGRLFVLGWDADERHPPAMLIGNNARLNRSPPLKGFGNNV